jgi:hypothetical protein
MVEVAMSKANKNIQPGTRVCVTSKSNHDLKFEGAFVKEDPTGARSNKGRLVPAYIVDCEFGGEEHFRVSQYRLNVIPTDK